MNNCVVLVHIEGKDRGVISNIFSKEVIKKQLEDSSRGYLFVGDGKTYCFDACFFSHNTFYFMTKHQPHLDDFKQMTKMWNVKLCVSWEEVDLGVGGWATIDSGKITYHQKYTAEKR